VNNITVDNLRTRFAKSERDSGIPWTTIAAAEAQMNKGRTRWEWLFWFVVVGVVIVLFEKV